MSKYLVVVESPTKAKKIQGYLGSDYNVIASCGHVLDLPPKNLGVDLSNDFSMTYEVIKGKEDFVKTVNILSKKVEMIYLASDPDRDGESISQEVLSCIKEKKIKYKRIRFHEITKEAIKKALQEATDINKDLVNAYEVRRITDRICGFKTSFPVRQATGGPSAGRVQSVGLRILSELEKEIKAFIPEIYWPIEAELLTNKKEKIIALIETPKPLDIKTEEEAKKIIEVFKNGKITVSEYKKTEAEVKPNPPFITSTLLQAASTYLGFSVARTTQLAQSLFEQGKITYIRTDSTNIAPEALQSIVDNIKNNYKPQYLPKMPYVYASKAKNAQEAHECIRPVDVNVQNIGGTPEEQKLYELILRRTISSQMTPAKYMRNSAKFSCEKYLLSASGSKELFDGFRKVWTYSDVSDQYLPELKVGEPVDLISIKCEKKETSPPGHYSEASFIKELEKRGIGRPSTYKTIVQTLQDRGYADKKGKSLIATDLGIKVSDYLISSNVCFIDIDFTCNMEEELDEIANKKNTKLDVLNKFWSRLQQDLKNMQSNKKESSKTEHKCPECDGSLLLKFGKFGQFLACENYSNKNNKCKYTSKVDKEGNPVEKTQKSIEESDIDCPNCGKKLLIKISKKNNNYLSCRNWKDKKCAGFYDMQGKKMEFNKKGYKKGYNKKKEGQEDT